MRFTSKQIAAVIAVVAITGTAGILLAENELPKELANNAFIKSFDLNKDGVVTEKEMIKQQDIRWKEKNPGKKESEEGKKRAEARIQQRFATLDLNKDGKIKGEEIPGRQSITREEFLKRALENFDSLDQNKDGKVTVEEREASNKKQVRAKATAGTKPAVNAKPAAKKE